MFDGKRDIWFQTNKGVTKHLQERNPFARMSNISSARPTFLDWDADGDVDLIYQDRQQKLQWVEQFQNGTLNNPQRLPVPENFDYVAADFDQDGDVDLVVAVQNVERWKYYERREDGSLDEVVDNPLDKSVWRTVAPSMADASILGIRGLYSTLGDWNGDGAPDLIVLDGKRVSLLLNKPLQTFIEHTGVDNPFSDIHIANPIRDSWNMVDVDGDGNLDFVYLPSGMNLVPTRKQLLPAKEEYKYFKQLKDGKLEQRDGSANPLQAAPVSLLSYSEWVFRKPEINTNGMNHVVADVDGDGDVDIVHADHRGFMYAEQQNGTFTVLKGRDNPFYLGLKVAIQFAVHFLTFPSSFLHCNCWVEVMVEAVSVGAGISNSLQHSSLDCWTLVDFDGDGDLDIVRTVPPNRSGYGVSQGSQEWTRLLWTAREVQYLEQATWRRGTHMAKPSWRVTSSELRP